MNNAIYVYGHPRPLRTGSTAYRVWTFLKENPGIEFTSTEIDVRLNLPRCYASGALPAIAARDKKLKEVTGQAHHLRWVYGKLPAAAPPVPQPVQEKLPVLTITGPETRLISALESIARSLTEIVANGIMLK